jgi:hypothetical protein
VLRLGQPRSALVAAWPRHALALKFMTRIIITGSKGRMGQALISCAKSFREMEIVAQIDKDDDLAGVIERATW